MKKSLIVLFVGALFLFSGCDSKPKESEKVSYKEANNITVYITSTGECYHTNSCSCLSKSKIEKELDIAFEKYRPCQLCFPPIIEE